MWVLITKLRSSNSIESKQRRKAAKALLVLIPLLGVGYMLVLVTPTHPTAKWVFQYSQAILVSTQVIDFIDFFFIYLKFSFSHFHIGIYGCCTILFL